MKKYFILGHFGGFNSGDEAMLGGFLSLIPKNNAVLVKYKNGIDVNWGNNVTLFHGSYPDFIKSIDADSTLVLCGGTHFHDDYNPIRLLRHWLYLARINYLFAQAKRVGARTLCLGNGFGSIKRLFTQYLTKQFTKLCDVVTVRDMNSLRVLNFLGCNADLVHPDLAMLLYQPDQPVFKRNIVGVSLTSLASQRAGFISDEQLVTAVADELTAFSMSLKNNVLIRLFVIRSGERESDALIMNQLHQRLQQNNVQSEVYEFANDLNALIEQMRPCKVFLASRFHSAVLGAVTQNRLIILSYHMKLLSFSEEVKMDSRFVVDLQQSDAVHHLMGLSKTITELYTADKLNYSFPEAAILQLGEQIRAFYEEGSNIRVHANLWRTAQSGKPAVPTVTGAGV